LTIGSCYTPRITAPTATKNQDLERWQTHQAEVASIENWELKGKISFKVGKKGGSATLKWIYMQSNQKIELYGPLGGGKIIINAGEKNAMLRDNKGLELRGSTTEDVLYQRLGWKVPFSELMMWSKGLPNPSATNLEFNKNGFLKSLDEGIWHVSYQEYQVTNHLTLPKKFTITSIPRMIEVYDDDEKYLGENLNIKIVLKHWWAINTHHDV